MPEAIPRVGQLAGLCALDETTGLWEPLKRDASGRLIVIVPATVTVQAAGGDKPFAIESRVYDIQSNLTLPSGYAFLPSSPVPTSKLWVVTHIAWCYEGTPPARVLIAAYIDAVNRTIQEWRTLTSGQWNGYPCKIYLAAAEYIVLQLVNATLNDNAYLAIFGYQMDAP